MNITVKAVPGKGNRKVIDTTFRVFAGDKLINVFTESMPAEAYAQGMRNGMAYRAREAIHNVKKGETIMNYEDALREIARLIDTSESDPVEMYKLLFRIRETANEAIGSKTS